MAVTCSAETHLGGTWLTCSRSPGHTGLHFSSYWQLWWASADNRAVTASGHTQTSAETSVADKIAAAVGGLGEDIGLSADDWSMRTSDMLEQLAARIRDGA